MAEDGDSVAPLRRDQQTYVQVIFDYFSANAQWPKRRYLERELLKRGLDARAIAKSLMGRIGDQFLLSWDPDSDAILTVPDLLLCRGSESVREAFIRTLQLSVIRYLSDDKPSISNLDLMVTLNMPDPLTRQVGRLFEVEPNLFRTMIHTATGWEMDISAQMFDYRDVRTIEDYLAVRWNPPQDTTSPDAVALLGGPGVASPIPSGRASASRDVFIVHGHDEAAREATARWIAQLGLHPIILHEQANQGLTIIEKFEKHAQVAFAVVLLTPDDVGASAATPDALQARARQNVILELGYFLGKLGRDHVCALYKGGVELPSDMSGVVYVAMDVDGAWKNSLTREFIAAGIEITRIP